MEQKDFEKLCSILKYEFKNKDLLRQALTHKSYTSDKSSKSDTNNERLEFLGDAVLDLVISEMLMERFLNLSEGGLSKFRASLVNEAGLTRVANSIGLGKFLLMGKGEELTGGRKKASLLADAMEAVFAAVYLDSREKKGLKSVATVIRQLFEPEIPDAVESFSSRDYKTELQEYIQKRYRTLVTYELVGESGPDHQKEFEMSVRIQNKEYARGKGMSKKQAAQSAAQKALDLFQKENIPS